MAIIAVMSRFLVQIGWQIGIDFDPILNIKRAHTDVEWLGRAVIGRVRDWLGKCSHLNPPFNHHLLNLRNCLGRRQTLGACLGAVHNGVAAIEAEGVFEIIEALACGFIAAVYEPAVSLQQNRWA